MSFHELKNIRSFSSLEHGPKYDKIASALQQVGTTRKSLHTESVTWRCSVKNVLLEISQNSQENICARVYFLIKLQASACNFFKKETLAQVFSCEFCEIPKNSFSCRTPLVAASVHIKAEAHLKLKRASMMKLFVKILNALLFSQKNSIIDTRLGSEEAFENHEIFKTKLRWSKSS